MRILAVADLHYNLPQFDWLVSVANRYDLLIIAGDLLDGGSFVTASAQMVVVLKYLERLRAIAPLVICSGNHDLNHTYSTGERYARWVPYARGPGAHADNETFAIGESVRVRGTGVEIEDHGDHQHYHVEDRARTFAPKSASLGVLYELPLGVVARLSGQYTERAPALPELFSKGLHHAMDTFEIGNPNLRKEAATSIEFGLRRSKGPFRFDFTAYHTRYQGYISKRLTGVLCGDDFDSCGVDTELKQAAWFSFEGAGTLDWGNNGVPEEMLQWPAWLPRAAVAA